MQSGEYAYRFMQKSIYFSQLRALPQQDTGWHKQQWETHTFYKHSDTHAFVFFKAVNKIGQKSRAEYHQDFWDFDSG